MPSINSPTLTLTDNGATVDVAVTYDVRFTELDRALVDAGMAVHVHADVVGMDPAGSLTGTVLRSFPTEPILGVTSGSGSQTIAVSPAPLAGVPRSDLDEDTAAGQDDEIRVELRVHCLSIPTIPSNVLPASGTGVFTAQRILVS